MPSADDRQVSVRLNGITHVFPSKKAYRMVSGSLQTIDTGIAAPNAAPTGASAGAGNVDGTVRYRVTYYDELSDTEGNPSAALTFVASTDTVTITFADTGPAPRYSHRRLYRTTDGGDDYFFLAQVAIATGNYSDNIADAALDASAGLLVATNGLPPDDIIDAIVHGARIHAIDDDNYYPSKAGNGDQWGPADVLQFSIGSPSRNRAIRTIGGEIVVFKDRETHMLGYDVEPIDPSDSWTTPIRMGRGCLNKRCAVYVGGALMVMDHEGIYLYTGAADAVPMDTDIRDVIDARNMLLSDWFCAVAGPDTVRFFFAMDGDGAAEDDPELHYCLKLDIASLSAGTGPEWWLEHYAVPIRDVWQHVIGSYDAIAGSARRVVPAAIAKDETCFVLDWLTSDGVPEGFTAKGPIGSWAHSGGDTVITNADAVFDSSDFGGYDLKNLFVSFQGSNGVIRGPYKIIATTATTFTVDGELDVADGETFRIGAIAAEFLSAQFRQPPFTESVQLSGFEVLHTPSPIECDAVAEVLRDNEGSQVYDSADAGHSGWATPAGSVATIKAGGSPASSGGLGAVLLRTAAKPLKVAQVRVSVRDPNVPLRITSIRPKA